MFLHPPPPKHTHSTTLKVINWLQSVPLPLPRWNCMPSVRSLVRRGSISNSVHMSPMIRGCFLNFWQVCLLRNFDLVLCPHNGNVELIPDLAFFLNQLQNWLGDTSIWATWCKFSFFSQNYNLCIQVTKIQISKIWTFVKSLKYFAAPVTTLTKQEQPSNYNVVRQIKFCTTAPNHYLVQHWIFSKIKCLFSGYALEVNHENTSEIWFLNG